MDEVTLLRIRRASNEEKRKTQKQSVAVGLADEKGFPHQGVLDFIDNQVNPQTGTIQFRAVLPNKDRLAAPGMFVRVQLTLGEPVRTLLIPSQAVLTEDGERFVFVVNKGVIEKRSVVLGLEQDKWRAVTKGLTEQDQVVSGRLTGLRPGMAVRPREGDAPAPKPKEVPDKEAQPLPSAKGQNGPGILVTATLPGANAEAVSERVRSPIEQQVGGMENLLFMRSRCTRDGQYALNLAFARGVDLNLMQILVQNRVALALPVLPQGVQLAGINVKRGSSGVLLIVNLVSPQGRYDAVYLGNYASIYVKDELARLAGVSEISLIGQGDSSLGIWLDPQRLAALNLNAGDVLRAINEQKKDELGRLADPDKFADLLLKGDGARRRVRLKDVANFEIGRRQPQSQAFLAGKPVVSLVVRLTGESPAKVRAAVRERLALLQARLPEGVELHTAFDFTASLEKPDQAAASECLLLDLDLPAGSTAERIGKTLERSETLLRQVPGVRQVLSLSENPFDLFSGGPCQLVLLSPAEQGKTSREEVIRTIRDRLNEIMDMTLRVRDLAQPGMFPRCGYPIDLALSGPEASRVRDWAQKLTELLVRSQKLTDVWSNRASAPHGRWVVDIDRQKAAALGVSPSDVVNTLQVYQGTLADNDFTSFGRTWRVAVQFSGNTGDRSKDLRSLQVRNKNGQMVSLGTLIELREGTEPLALDFLDYQPMVALTANLQTGVSAEQARKLCEALAEGVSQGPWTPSAVSVDLVSNAQKKIGMRSWVNALLPAVEPLTAHGLSTGRARQGWLTWRLAPMRDRRESQLLQAPPWCYNQAGPTESTWFLFLGNGLP